VIRPRSAAVAVVASAALVGTVALTTHLANGEGVPKRRLVVSGGIPQGAAVTAAAPANPPPRHSAPHSQPGPQDRYAAWATTMSARTGVPARALVAYAAAQQALAREQPACGISWPTLAGIGYVESDNGGLGGGLLADGRPLQDIVGVALTGAGAVAAVGDTDDGRLDGDPTVDRAVGPLQFLPATWEQWSSDGDHDGLDDPQDIDDAALAAARYLCVSGDLRTGDGWTDAVLSYNHSTAYLDAVYAAGQAYAERSEG
jgi:membrane-bound lytic murein transglycosylase B